MGGAATLMWGVFFGSLGAGYLVYGKRQRAAMPLLCGIGLMVFPSFVTNVYLMVLVGAVLLALPWLPGG